MNPSYPGSSGDRHGPPSLSASSSSGLGGKGGPPSGQQQQQTHSYHPQPSLAQLGHLHPLHGGSQQPQQPPQHSMMHPGGPVLPPPPLPGSLGGGGPNTSRSPHPLSGSILHPPRGNLGGSSGAGSVLGKPAGSQGPPPSGASGLMGHSVRMQAPSMSQSMGSVQQSMASSSGGLKPPTQSYSVRPPSPPRRPQESQQQQQQQQQQVPMQQQQYGLDGRIIPNDQVEGDYYQQQQTISVPPPRHRELRVEDALLYLDQVKQQFGDQPDIYNQFLDVMKDFKAQAIDTPGVILRVSTLFRGYPNLILGFNTFLPPGYRIRPDTSIEVIPSQMAGRGGVQPSMFGVGAPQSANANMGHRPPPVTIPPPPYSPPELHKPTPSSRQQLAPASQMKTGGKPKKQQQQAPTPNGGNAAARSSTNPVEFDHAIHYVTTIKQRFADEPETYKEFLAILHTYQKEQRSIRQVLDQVSHLFRDHPDLLREFTFFLPDAVQEQAKERLNRAAEKAQQRKDQMAQKARKYGSSSQGYQPDRRDDRGPDSPSSAAMKGGRMMADEEDAYMKYGKKGSGRGYKDDDHRLSGKALERREKERERERNRSQFNHKRAKRRPYDGKERRAYLAISDVLLDKEEWNIFEKIKKILPSRDNWREFLKCLELYSQEVLDRNEMLSLIRNLFGRHTDLVEEFDHLLCSHGVQKTPKEIWPFIPLAETDLSQCRRATPSYRGLPASYPIPPCSHRSALEKQVCNDSWVSVPTGSEDFSFKSMRKNQYEEALFKCEDERFEIDMVIEANASTISILEPLAHEIEVLKKSKESSGDDDKLWNYVVDKGTFRVTHLNAITRIYGESGSEILELLRKHPAGAIPIILKRLKQKDEEWRRAREDLNRQWKDVNEKNYHKSLDHSSFYFKQKDKKQTSMKMMMQEAKKKLEADEKRAEEAKTDSNASPSTVSATSAVVGAKAPPQALDIANALKKEQSTDSAKVPPTTDGKVAATSSQATSSTTWKPHFAYKFASVQIHKEAFGLLSYAAEKNLSVADKEKISKVWQAFFFPFFHLEEEWLVRKPQHTTVTLEKAKTLPVGTEVSTEFGEGTVQQFNRAKAHFTINLAAVGCQAYLQPSALTIQEAADFPPGLPELDSKQDAAKVQADYKSLFYGNQHAYAFLRLYQMLQNRLERAFDLCEKAKRNRNRRTINPAARALAHAHHSLSASTKEKTGDYQAFVSKLYSLIDGSVDNSKYEDSCRSLMGSTSYFLFTMDKLVTQVLKQMQHLANDDTCQELTKAFAEVQGEPKPSTDPAGAEAKTTAYLNKTKSIFEGEGAFRIEFNPGVLRKTPLEARGGTTPSGVSEPFKIWAPSPRVKAPESSKWLIEPKLAIEYLGSMDEDGDGDDDDDESPSATPVDTPSATPMYGSPVLDTPVHDSQDDEDELMEESKEDDDMKKDFSTPASSGSVEQSDSASASSDDAHSTSAMQALESATLLKKRARDSSEEGSAVSETSLSASSLAADESVAAKKAKTTIDDEASADAAKPTAASQEDDPMERVEKATSSPAAKSDANEVTPAVKVEKPQEQIQDREVGKEAEQTAEKPKEQQQTSSLDKVKSERPSECAPATPAAAPAADLKARAPGSLSVVTKNDDKRKE
ncbi:Paired amphipathic helix protein Sin3b [Phytophthora pseudosyringae]|uniref:Paired amphipathic helix protein Sin3b n=1 Tax=Phytophthora pseudosyringae TaxID=221518 RepID=A0A8T1WHC4_9STRA|nr:Paired amphipathic helix protein Sin3b [Phytophthora pseudosyringae]